MNGAFKASSLASGYIFASADVTVLSTSAPWHVAGSTNMTTFHIVLRVQVIYKGRLCIETSSASSALSIPTSANYFLSKTIMSRTRADPTC